ncbi:Flp family type IVb pilin [Chthonobacter rhizosphaerae]|uniref:Flp family type IVb pilin n=1 Tax=Chthonobacter rhizosphaerae TaxID=2735553 RepID=UPI0015EE7DAE|nr:hypothetical protein [Chthonobacter rhizosphaerae]
MKRIFSRLLCNRSGSVQTEYGFAAALIVAGLVVASLKLGQDVGQSYSRVSEEIITTR